MENEASYNEQFLDERALAKRWSISVRTLQNRRVSGGGLAYVKIGRSVRYRLSEIIEAERAGVRLSTSDREV